MSKNTITELFLIVDSRDWDKMISVFCPNIVYERPGYAPIVGIDQLLHFYQHERVIASGKHDLEHIVIDRHRGSCWGRFLGVKKDGTDIDELFADVYIFEDEKIKERRSYFFRPAI
ncbi:nuclear transport factor 2 family protein [Dictyobacter aurantiacus]|uniref:SnoaL-like domain-containing protein n=1 Tax=Dictyobacter aurantiacus TaxID=1936993 RepID=A0A401ZS90_9CHLR|nr:nuclear transport factor 2 family protein [Dictyobacter aurantiacus]GCE09778.1 hypothetical protein KDAU_71070 [Dictyobacter aurantiacus]